MEFIKAIIGTINFFLIIGIVGGMERNTISMSKGFWICIAISAITYIILDYKNIFEKVKNISAKPIDKQENV